MPARSHQIDSNHYLLAGIAFSILVHIFFGWSLIDRRPAPVPLPFIADIIFEPPKSAAAKTQIVSVPEAEPAPKAPPLDTNLRAERDASVEKEQIKRGDPEAGVAVGPKQRPAKQSSTQAPRAAELPRAHRHGRDGHDRPGRRRA